MQIRAYHFFILIFPRVFLFSKHINSRHICQINRHAAADTLEADALAGGCGGQCAQRGCTLHWRHVHRSGSAVGTEAGLVAQLFAGFVCQTVGGRRRNGYTHLVSNLK